MFRKKRKSKLITCNKCKNTFDESEITEVVDHYDYENDKNYAVDLCPYCSNYLW